YGPAGANQFINFMPVYFGTQPSTSGPVYAGAIIIFLFVLALMVVKGKIKWWLLALTVLSILLSWGKNFMWLTDLFLDYFPGYNKFRTVSMTLVIAELTMPLLAFLGLREIVLNKIELPKLKNYFFISLGITGVVLLSFIAVPSVFGYESDSEVNFVKAQIFPGIPDGAQYESVKNDIMYEFTTAIQSDRMNLVRKDSARSLAFILLAALVLWLLIKQKVKLAHASIALAVLILVDMWPINKRYLNEDNFISKRNFEIPYTASIADNHILADADNEFRVCNLSMGLGGVFADASTSYFHKSIGGYHGAKMLRYQELMDSVMSADLYMAYYLLEMAYQSNPSEQSLQVLFDNNADFSILNMLNTKYFIINPEMRPIKNNKALGNAWFVKDFSWVDDANEEILAMRDLNTADEAVVDVRYENILKDFKPKYDSSANIKLISYAPNRLKYESNATSAQLAVFSEIFYSKGWKVYVDGEETPHFRANYVLRSMIVPEGKHEIEFVFDPKSYKTGNMISYISSAIILILIGFFTFLFFRKKGKSETS
ncbi:MAG: YfhO family protein, partial [Bacteroidales bacterium]|nr:YfhO family protein [Bacteroidales bacterium]